VANREERWPIKLLVNGGRALVTAVVTVIVLASKFLEGAWIVVLLVPTLVLLFQAVHRHYAEAHEELRLVSCPRPHPRQQPMLIPVSGMDRVVAEAIQYACAISDVVCAVHVAIDEDKAAVFQRQWQAWAPFLPLKVAPSPYREITFIAAANATQALVAHEIDALFVGAASIIAANLNGHQDLVYLASLDNHSSFALFGQPSVNSAADLKGKVVASDRPGTTFDYVVRVALDQLGLKPTDVDIRALGNSSVVYEALIGVQAAAAPLAPPFTFQAQAKGYKLLKDEYSIAYQDVGVVVSKSQLARIGPQMPGFLTAIRQGIDAYNSQPDVAIKVLQQYTKETDQTVLQKTYDFYKSTVPFEKSMRPTLDGIKAMIDFLSATIPKAKTATPQQFVDTSYLDKLNLLA